MRARAKPSAGLRILKATCSICAFVASAAIPAAALGPAAASPAVATLSPPPILVPPLQGPPGLDTLPPSLQETALPDAPEPQLPTQSIAADAPPSPPASLAFSLAGAVSSLSNAAPAPKLTNAELDAACQSGALRGKPCKLEWLPMLWEALEATAIENGGNIALDSDTRNDLAHNPYWATYVKCVHQYRFRQWTDDTPFIVHGIGHPMQGASVYSIFAQNDPKSRGLLIANTGNYWRAHLKAMAFVTLFEIQWKIGPASEAAIGNSGLNTYTTPALNGKTTNETGFQDFVITPVFGLGWNIAEDLVDRFVMPHIWKRTHNKLILTALLPLTPCRDAANILRYKPFYYRDYPLTPLR
jgi:hypothetical protein